MSRKPIGRQGRPARLAVLLCAGVLALTGCDFSVYSLPLPGGADLGDDPYSVRVKFRDVLDLVPQSAVKVNDVTVGKVDQINLDGYTADVTIELRKDVKLPDNAEAEIRQTSLLGEKFVSLKPPAEGASPQRLGDGDVIPLDSSGRNPEVEEVLGALSLLLNGGGVGQLKTISTELNKALGGREGDVRSVLDQLGTFMKQIDDNKQDIVHAIDSLNKLAVSVNKQRGSIELALDQMPQALASIDRQRDDLVKMLRALTQLSSVGTKVIRASKVATIDSLQQLDPILGKLAEAGDALPKAFQVFLTYPFVDEVVGRNPAQARNLHMGDYTNLSIQLDVDLRHGLPTLPGLPPVPGLPGLPGGLSPQDLKKKCKATPLAKVCDQLPGAGTGASGGSAGGVLDGILGGGSSVGKTDANAGSPSTGTGSDDSSGCLLPPLVCRPAPSVGDETGSDGQGAQPMTARSGHDRGYDPTLGALLTWGMVQR